jgi:nucleotide-binding universal stress UspA family protein
MSNPLHLLVMLPVDGSPAALAAVGQAVALRDRGLPLRALLVNVQEPPTLYEVVVAHDRERLDAVRAAAGADLLAPAEALLDAAGLPYESEVLGGEPAATLLDRVETAAAELVIVGARGAGERGERHTAPGSVALALLQHAPVPVMLVHEPEPEPKADADTTGGA